MTRTIVIGGGISGLATAALLAREGHRVTLVEQRAEVGGRAGVWERDGFRFDTGPSWYLMPEIFEHFFALLGTSADAELDLVRLDPAYRAWFTSGAEPLEVRSDADDNVALFESVEPGAGARLRRYLGSARDTTEVAREHQGTHGIVGDVAAKDDIYPMALQILGELGGLDVLINNASDLGPVPLALLGDTECEDLERALMTNVVGPFRLTKALLGALAASARDRRGAVVLNISSDAAVNAYPAWGAYSASKAALRHMTHIWDAELASEGVRFLSIDPGDMDTPMHAAAVPDADRSTLKQPGVAARELVEAIVHTLDRAAGPEQGKGAAA